MGISLGREIENAAVINAKRVIKEHTNCDGFISLKHLQQIRNLDAREIALTQMRYTAVHGKTSSALLGYKQA